MQLIEKGKIDLDAPVIRYLPYFRLDDEHLIGSPGYTGRGVTNTVVDWRGKTLRKLPSDELARKKILDGT